MAHFLWENNRKVIEHAPVCFTPMVMLSLANVRETAGLCLVNALAAEWLHLASRSATTREIAPGLSAMRKLSRNGLRGSWRDWYWEVGLWEVIDVPVVQRAQNVVARAAAIKRRMGMG